jgi:hypothetical protein
MNAAPISHRTRSSGQAADVLPIPAAVGRRASPTCGTCGEVGHRSTKRACPGRVSQALAELVAYAADNASDDSANNVINVIRITTPQLLSFSSSFFP